MRRCSVWVLFLLAVPQFTTAQTNSQAFPLFQVKRVFGDAVAGFKRSCLIVYSDGRFRREQRHEHSEYGHPQDRWDPPQVFDGQLPTDKVRSIWAMTQRPDFRSLPKVVGEIRPIPSMVLFARGGIVVAHADIDLMSASVLHPDQTQIFEVSALADGRKLQPVAEFLDSIDGIESAPATRLDTSVANDCTPETSGDKEQHSSGFDTGIHLPVRVAGTAPPLPKGTKRHKIEVAFVVNPDGTVTSVSVKSPTSADLEKNIIQTVMAWKFYPGQLFGVPVAFNVDMKLE